MSINLIIANKCFRYSDMTVAMRTGSWPNHPHHYLKPFRRKIWRIDPTRNKNLNSFIKFHFKVVRG
jgi:hypothetical protein